MREQMQLRLEELKKEFEIGQHRLQETERQQALLRETLLRISGAIQVLEEVLSNSEGRQDDHQSAYGGQDAGSSKQFPRLTQNNAAIATEQKATRV